MFGVNMNLIPDNVFFRLNQLNAELITPDTPDSLVEEKDENNTSNFHLRGCVNLMAFPMSE